MLFGIRLNGRSPNDLLRAMRSRLDKNSLNGRVALNLTKLKGSFAKASASKSGSLFKHAFKEPER
jgi:hypothetical protein